MTTYYCAKNPKCPAKNVSAVPVTVPTCCNTPMTTTRNNKACCDTPGTKKNIKTNMNPTPKKDCCCS